MFDELQVICIPLFSIQVEPHPISECKVYIIYDVYTVVTSLMTLMGRLYNHDMNHW